MIICKKYIIENEINLLNDYGGSIYLDDEDRLEAEKWNKNFLIEENIELYINDKKRNLIVNIKLIINQRKSKLNLFLKNH